MKRVKVQWGAVAVGVGVGALGVFVYHRMRAKQVAMKAAQDATTLRNVITSSYGQVATLANCQDDSAVGGAATALVREIARQTSIPISTAAIQV